MRPRKEKKLYYYLNPWWLIRSFPKTWFQKCLKVSGNDDLENLAIFNKSKNSSHTQQLKVGLYADLLRCVITGQPKLNEHVTFGNQCKY